MMLKIFKRCLLVLLTTLGAAGCATLPDTDALIARHSTQEANFETARGPVSARQNTAILASLQRKSGDLDILDKQMALEQAISDSPLVLGNKVSLLQDGAATYAAMFGAIRQAKDHINLETYIIEDDATGDDFATLLLAAQARGVQVNLIYDSVGGINISNVYAMGSFLKRAPKPPPEGVMWRDTDLKIEGPVVAEFQKLFLQTWDKQKAPALAAKTYFPKLSPQGNDIVRAIGSTPDDPFSLIYLTLISAIGNAEKTVHLTNAYFVPDPQLLKALRDAAARGVQVQLILPSHSDSELVFHAGRAHYAELLAGGVQIYERQGALLHAKTAVIDGVWSTVGSTNLDWRSFLDNDEVNAVVLGREFATQMQAMHQQDLDASQRITPQAWAERPLQFKLKEWLAQHWGRLL